MMKSSAVLSGSFDPTVQFEKLEIHKVFLRFSNFHSCQNLSPITLADFIIGYLSPLTYQFSCRDKKIAPGGFRAETFMEWMITRTGFHTEFFALIRLALAGDARATYTLWYDCHWQSSIF